MAGPVSCKFRGGPRNAQGGGPRNFFRHATRADSGPPLGKKFNPPLIEKDLISWIKKVKYSMGCSRYLFRVCNHHMHVEEYVGESRSETLYHWMAKCQVRNKMSVHNILVSNSNLAILQKVQIRHVKYKFKKRDSTFSQKKDFLGQLI